MDPQENAQELGPSSVVTRSPEILDAEIDGETVMMSIENGEYYGLDEIGSTIWQLLEEPRSVDDLCRTLRQEYDVEEDKCRRDVTRFLGELAADGSIVVLQEAPS